jgi:hypothetical protein
LEKDSLVTTRLALAYFLPFCLFVLTDLYFGREPYSFPNDNIPGFFGLGLNLATSSFGLSFHMPAYSFIEIASLLSLVFLNEETLTAFFFAGVGLHLLFAAFAALWLAPIARHLGLGGTTVVSLSLMVTTMPTVALYAPLYCTYPPTALFLVPVALGVVVVMTDENPPPWIAKATLFGIGFLAANLFLTLAVPVALGFGLAWLALAHGTPVIRARLGEPPLGRPWNEIAFVAFVSVLVGSLVNVPIVQRYLPWGEAASWLASVAAVVLSWWLARRWQTSEDACLRFILPILLGWALASNVHAIRWVQGAGAAWMSKGGASPRLPLTEVLSRADLWNFFSAWNWHIFIAAGAAVLLAMAFARAKAQSLDRRIVAMVALVILGVSAIVGADVSFLRPSAGWPGYGQESRYQIVAIASVAIAMTLLATTGRRWQRGMVAGVVGVAGLSLADYGRAAAVLVPESEAIERELAAAIDRHLAAHTGNNVICARTVQPAPCAVLYGFNNYRLPDSLKKLDRKELGGGRILYAATTEEALVLAQSKTMSGRSLVIFEGSLPPGAHDRLSPLAPVAEAGPKAAIFVDRR